MQNDNIIKSYFANIYIGLRYAYKYEENKRKIKIGKEKK